MDTQQRIYESYLLRIWRDSTQSEWRASIKDVASDTTIKFPSIARLFLFLVSRMEHRNLVDCWTQIVEDVESSLDDSSVYETCLTK